MITSLSVSHGSQAQAVFESGFECPPPGVLGSAATLIETTFEAVTGEAIATPGAGAQGVLSLNNNNVVAMSFVAPTGNLRGTVQSVSLGGHNGRRKVSISICPGVISQTQIASDCADEFDGAMGWTIQPRPGECQLEPGLKYYLNFAIRQCDQSDCQLFFVSQLRAN